MLKIGPASLEPRKCIAFILLGAMGFAGSFLAINFSYPPFSIAINWCDFLPLLAGLAYGGRYGFIASTVGLGGLYPFAIWPNNGWACLLTAVLSIAWPTVNGYVRALHQRKPAFWNRPLLAFLVSSAAYNGLLLAFFPLAMRFNPPFWNPRAALAMPQDVLLSIVIKGFIIFCVLAVLADFLLKIPAIRKALGLSVNEESRYNAQGGARGHLGVLAGMVRLRHPQSRPSRRKGNAVCLRDPRSARDHRLPGFPGGRNRLRFGPGVLPGVEAEGAGFARPQPGAALGERGKIPRHLRERAGHVYETSLDGTILEVSPSVEILSRGQYRRADVLGRSMYDLYADPHSRDDIVAKLEERGSVNDFEVRLKNRDESPLYCSISAKLIRGDDGRPLKILGSMHDIAERTRAEAKIRQALAEKETLLHELFHRANNNMQVISALLGIQATTGDAKFKRAVADVQDRILSIALVNQKLYESNDLSQINLRSYIEDLARALLSSLERKTTIALVSDMEDVFVLIDSAIPCGLIVNELISNIYKHAYPDDVEGTMDVLLRKSPSGIVTLRIADHGVGVPPDFESRRQERLGINYILGICVNQLHGKVHFDEGGGLACVITFSDHLWERRI